VNGDGIAEIVTGAGAGGGPHVRLFDGVTGTALIDFFAYDPGFTGGVRVAVGDLNGDGYAELVTGAGPGGGPHVRVFDLQAANPLVFDALAFDAAFTGGVFVAAPTGTGRMALDLAAPSGGGEVRVAGWALREGSTDSGTDAIHAWAYPVGGGDPVFVGAAAARLPRFDVATVFGGEVLLAGFDFTGTLAPGTYDLVVYARNARTLIFDQARVVRVVVP
jgi:hypothetical protein